MQSKEKVCKSYNQPKKTLCNHDDCNSFNTATLKKEIRVKLFLLLRVSVCACVSAVSETSNVAARYLGVGWEGRHPHIHTQTFVNTFYSLV